MHKHFLPLRLLLVSSTLLQKGTPLNQLIRRSFVCGIVEDYRTFIEDFKRVLEFVEWLEDGEY